MHLRKRSAAKRRRIDVRKQLVARIAVNVVDGGQYLVERKRIAFHLKLRQLVAVRLRQYLGARRKRLPDLDEARAQVLQHGAELLGREAFEKAMFLKDGVYLLQPARPRSAIEVEPILGIDIRAGAEEVFEQRVLPHECLLCVRR